MLKTPLYILPKDAFVSENSLTYWSPKPKKKNSSTKPIITTVKPTKFYLTK